MVFAAGMKSRLLITLAVFGLFQGISAVLGAAEERLWGLGRDTGHEITDSLIEKKAEVPGLLVFPSPDKRLAISWPDRETAEKQDFDVSHHVVDLRTGKSVARIVDGDGDFENRNHGGMRVRWRVDSRAVILRLEGKWSPRWVVVVEMTQEGRIRETNLLKPVAEAFATMFASSKSSRELWKKAEAGVERLDCNVGCDFDKSGTRLFIEAECEMNPKRIAGQTYLAGELKGTFDLGTGRLTVSSQKITDARVVKED